jgi:GT2 family glycosyltransferase
MGLTSNIFGIPKPNRLARVEPFFASGAGMLVRNDVLHATGGFDPAFYFGAEELDLIWRARLLGHHIRTVPEAVVYHKTEGTRKRLSADRLHLGLRNTIRMELKNYDCPSTS